MRLKLVNNTEIEPKLPNESFTIDMILISNPLEIANDYLIFL